MSKGMRYAKQVESYSFYAFTRFLMRHIDFHNKIFRLSLRDALLEDWQLYTIAMSSGRYFQEARTSSALLMLDYLWTRMNHITDIYQHIASLQKLSSSQSVTSPDAC